MAAYGYWMQELRPQVNTINGTACVQPNNYAAKDIPFYIFSQDIPRGM
jgi:hypothetical protein